MRKFGYHSFNRTILELKYENYLRTHKKAMAFNRTILELKSKKQHNGSSKICSFNRTILELKLRIRMEIHTRLRTF